MNSMTRREEIREEMEEMSSRLGYTSSKFCEFLRLFTEEDAEDEKLDRLMNDLVDLEQEILEIEGTFDQLLEYYFGN